jgi:CheY-like chemotaxis protein
VLQEQVMTSEAHAVPHISGETTPRQFQGLKALLVDDMPVMAKILGRALDRLGVSYDHAANGLEAVEALQRAPYDIIFMDIMMPEMDGIAATRKIRKLDGGRITCPIVAVTTKASPSEVANYKVAGMNDCMRKPVDKVSLEVMLHRLITALPVGTPSPDPEYDILSPDDLEAVNWDTLREYSTVLKSGLKGLIQDYLAAAPSLLEVMADALNNRDAEKVHTYANQFKSASVVFGAEKVSHMAAGLEIMAGNGNLDNADALFFDLHIAFEHTKIALQKKLIILSNL